MIECYEKLFGIICMELYLFAAQDRTISDKSTNYNATKKTCKRRQTFKILCCNI